MNDQQKENAKIKAQYRSVQITNVKINSEEVEIQYSQSDTGMTGSVCLSLDEKNALKNTPTPEFKNSLQELAKHVCEICEWDAEEEASTINVHGVILKYKGEDGEKIMGAQISASKKLLKTKAVMNFLTPYLPELVKEKNSGAARLTPDAATQVHEVIQQARLYLSNERAQTKMEFEKKEKD
jgi:hypothetical protein